MKKAKIILSTLVTGILLICALCACNKSPNDVFQSDAFVDEEKEYTLAKKLDFPGYRIEQNKEQLLSLVKTDAETGLKSFIIYDIAKKDVVTRYSDSEDDELLVNYTIYMDKAELRPYYYLQKKTTYKTINQVPSYDISLVSSSGDVIRTISGRDTAFDKDNEIEDVFNLITFDNSVFSISKTGAITCLSAGLAPTIPEDLDVYCEDRYYVLPDKTDLSHYQNLEESGQVLVYDKSLNLTAFYYVPSFALDVRSYILNNGNVFVQYVKEKFENDNSFDIVLNNGTKNNKYELYQVVLDCKTGSVTELNAKAYYYIKGTSRATSEDDDLFNGFNKNYNNVFTAYPIKDKYVDQNPYSSHMVIVADNMNVTKSLDSNIFKNFSFLGSISPERLLARDSQGRKFILDLDFKVIGEIPIDSVICDKYIVTSTKIYDFDLKTVYDFASNGYSLIPYTKSMGKSIVLIKKNAENETEIFFFRDGQVKKIAKVGEMNALNTLLYCITSQDENQQNVYKLYGTQGTLLLTSSLPFNYDYVEYDSCDLIYTEDGNGNREYYLLYV